MHALIPLSIPSPAEGVWHLGPLPVRAYALCIIAGVIAAVWLGEKRWVARRGRSGEIGDVAIWAVPFGLVGARLYHVATDHDLYFGPGKHAVDALYIWHGGLGIWGGVAGGILGGVFAAKRRGIRMRPLMDTIAPTLLLAQAIGRFGNYFNQELYGRPTTLPWGLEISPSHYPAGDTFPTGTLFHPTFLYEAIWNILGMAILLYVERRYKLGYGRVFALYVMIYTAGRGWIESLRIDDIELNNVLGLRWGVWMSIILFALALAYFVWATVKRPGREESPYVEGRRPELDGAHESTGDAGDAGDADPAGEPDDVVEARATGKGETTGRAPTGDA